MTHDRLEDPPLSAAPKITPVHLTPAYELVGEQIRRAIHLGLFLPGQRLPSERDLAEQMNVSRSTIREAVRLLVADGSLSVRRGATGGLIVNEVHARDPEELRAYARRKRAELNEIFEFRLVVEAATARFAAERRNEENLRNMQGALAMMDAAIAASSEEGDRPDPIARFNAADTSFHMEIARASKNQHFIESVESIRRAMFLPVGGVFIKLRPDANAMHEPIYNAIVDRDGERASAIMCEHVQATRLAMVDFLDGPR